MATKQNSISTVISAILVSYLDEQVPAGLGFDNSYVSYLGRSFRYGQATACPKVSLAPPKPSISQPDPNTNLTYTNLVFRQNYKNNIAGILGPAPISRRKPQMRPNPTPSGSTGNDRQVASAIIQPTRSTSTAAAGSAPDSRQLFHPNPVGDYELNVTAGTVDQSGHSIDAREGRHQQIHQPRCFPPELYTDWRFHYYFIDVNGDRMADALQVLTTARATRCVPNAANSQHTDQYGRRFQKVRWVIDANANTRFAVNARRTRVS